MKKKARIKVSAKVKTIIKLRGYCEPKWIKLKRFDNKINIKLK